MCWAIFNYVKKAKWLSSRDPRQNVEFDVKHIIVVQDVFTLSIQHI